MALLLGLILPANMIRVLKAALLLLAVWMSSAHGRGKMIAKKVMINWSCDYPFYLKHVKLNSKQGACLNL